MPDFSLALALFFFFEAFLPFDFDFDFVFLLALRCFDFLGGLKFSISVASSCSSISSQAIYFLTQRN